MLKGITPDSLDHIEDFFLRKIIIDGKPVKAAGNIEEAFLMAYIEKNMGNFSYKGRQIFEYDDSGHKKKALINLVKDMNKFRIKKELSVICN